MRLVQVLGVVMTVSCVGDEAIDGEHDRYIVDGKSDTAGLQEATPAAGAVLRIANTFSRTKLINDVGLPEQAAANITAYRAGDDGAAGTSDDEEFDTLAELDAVPFVGPIAFGKLLAYAEAHGLIGDPSGVNNDPFDPAACQGPNITTAAAEARYKTNPVLANYTVQLRKRTCSSTGSCGAWQTVSASSLPWDHAGADGSGRLLFGRWDPGSPVKLYVQDAQCEQTASYPERFTVGAACDGIGTNKLSCSVYNTPGICYEIEEDGNERSLYWESSQFLFYGKLTENCVQLISNRKHPDGTQYDAAILVRF